MGADLVRHLDGPAHVAHVVERVENAKDVDAVGVGADDKALQDVVGIVLVADDVLAAQQHHEGRVGYAGFEPSNALPGVLIQKAHG
jgi:hypothetical protein